MHQQGKSHTLDVIEIEVLKIRKNFDLGIITIQHPIGPSFISIINTKQKIYYNNLGIRLDCLARGNPLPIITWFRMNSTDDRLLIPVQSSELM